LGENLYVIKRVVLCAEKFERKHGIYTYAVQVWLKKLKDALDDVVHLLDQFSTQDLKKKNSRNLQIFFSSSNHLVFSFNMSTKIKDLAKRTASLKIFCESYPHPCVQTPHSTIVKTRFFFTNPPPQFFAREKEKKDLMDFLFNTNDNAKDNVSVIFIIGEEGIGKSALAQIAFNDKEVQQYFDLIEWLSMYNMFDIKRIGKSIAGSCTSNTTLESVRKKILNKVQGKRYLLVLDDIFIEHSHIWLALMSFLEGAAQGSKIIITTRIKKVAMIFKTTNPSLSITLDKLDEQNSWRMFCFFAFEDKKEPEDQYLVSIGKEIVQKCFGIPQAIYSIGLLMLFQKKEKWSYFKNKNLVEIDEQGVLTIYQHDC
jgi:hypothetical protein